MNQETVKLLIDLVQRALEDNETSKGDVRNDKRQLDLWIAMTKLDHLLED